MSDEARDRLEDALELSELAERMVRCRLRREAPELDADELERRVLSWLQQSRGAVDGDAEGRVVGLARRS
jgi:hypothetical protein